jgi:hypothetical protein
MRSRRGPGGEERNNAAVNIFRATRAAHPGFFLYGWARIPAGGGKTMLTAGMNDLAMIRFGGFRFGHGGGEGFALLLMGLVAVGVLVWALSHSDHNQSAKG